MNIAKLVGLRSKENPADASIKSHVLLVRAGYIKQMSNGIWSMAMPAKRIATKIENIIRQELDAIDGQEITLPVVMPKELWEESGRYSSIGEEMARFNDRSDRGLVLGMTHEEAAVHLARDWVSSYQQLPFMIYQVQTKFRDEARSRGGLLRVREFTMCDAYSFHTTQEDLEQYYSKAYDAYNRIFERIGLQKFVAVMSDAGMMGGNISHEYMALQEIGEDKIIICPHCNYKANMEVALSCGDTVTDSTSQELAEVFTGEAHEITEVCNLLNIAENKTIKAVTFNVKGSETLVVCFIRGDKEVNEAKLKKAIGKDIAPMSLAGSTQLVAGNIGLLNLKLDNAIIVYDNSLKGANNMVTGANKADYHISGVDMARDMSNAEYVDIAKVKAGELCTVCGKPLELHNGVEIGNIFQLGTKYTKSMGMKVLDNNGKAINPIMGCYGIGIGRAIASVAEEHSDDKGLVWPVQIAPWHVYLCSIKPNDPTVKETMKQLEEQLVAAGIEVLTDDRNVSPGFKFSDCDLMGIPVRLVVSPRALATNEIEVQTRQDGNRFNIAVDKTIDTVKKLLSL